MNAHRLDVQIAQLEEMLAAGVTSASYDGKRVEYRSLRDMRSVLAELRARRAGIPRVRTTYASYSGD